MISSDPVLDERVKKTSEKISENLHIIANDPSLAFYRMQEHIRKVMPMIVERRAEVEHLQRGLQGRCYDLEYSLSAIKSVDKSDETFKNVQELLKSAIFLKQQLKGEEAKRRPSTAGSQNSVYKRLSAHIQTTLELPDLDFSVALRETTSRVENMMSTARNGSTQNSVTPSSRASSSSNVSVSSEVMQRSHTTLH
ncbi:BLOC-1-related complex subunit 8 homolog [Sitodiplosis mosellana]|uniref:BLOC-1-related complex subunit 8 homolog n=1 Tax=Sitodiplosis mosellana TaxID=263140 RepID=UPI0024452B73|nr:BLOC-1-related complex subunit 8 homolog [Sitodiplosis mosellana]